MIQKLRLLIIVILGIIVAEFASLDGMNQSIPSNGVSADRLQLTTPNSMITGTTAGLQALGAQNIKTDTINQRIVVNDGITNRVSFGKIGTGVNDWGLKVSKPNFNVDNAINNQLAFNSSQNVFKIVASSTFSIPGLYTGEQTYAHNLGYVPAFQAYIFVSNDTHYYQVPWLLIDNTTGAINALVTASADINNFYVDIKEFTGLQPMTIKFYLLQETAT